MSCQEAQDLEPRAGRPFQALWRKVFHLLPPSHTCPLSPVCTSAVHKTWARKPIWKKRGTKSIQGALFSGYSLPRAILSRKETAEGRERKEEGMGPHPRGWRGSENISIPCQGPRTLLRLLRWCKNCSNKLQQFGFVVKRKFQNPSDNF